MEALVYDFRLYSRYYIKGLCGRHIIIKSNAPDIDPTYVKTLHYEGCFLNTDVPELDLHKDEPLAECAACLSGLCSVLKSNKLKQKVCLLNSSVD